MMKSMSSVEQLNAAIQAGELEECRRLYSLIAERPVELNLPARSNEREYWDLNNFVYKLTDPKEKMELVWPTMAKYAQHYYDSGARERTKYLLNAVVELGYCPDNARLRFNLDEDSDLISTLRKIGWVIEVDKWYGGLMKNLMEVKNIATNIEIGSLEAGIIDNQYAIVEYLDLRGIKYKRSPNFVCDTLGMVMPRIPKLKDALQDRNELLVYLHYYWKPVPEEFSEEFIRQIKTLTIDEIIRCANSYLIEQLIELKVELPTLNQVLTALLASDHRNRESLTMMFLVLVHHNPQPIDSHLLPDLIKGLDSEGVDEYKQEYGSVIVTIARYKLACLEEYRDHPFVNHLLELTVSKTKPTTKEPKTAEG